MSLQKIVDKTNKSHENLHSEFGKCFEDVKYDNVNDKSKFQEINDRSMEIKQNK